MDFGEGIGITHGDTHGGDIVHEGDPGQTNINNLGWANMGENGAGGQESMRME